VEIYLTLFRFASLVKKLRTPWQYTLKVYISMACTICDQAITDEEPSMTLLCLHKYHTLCFLQSKAGSFISDIHCPTCDVHIVPNDVLEAAEQFHSGDTKNEVIKFLWETDENFKAYLIHMRTLKHENVRLSRIYNKKEAEVLKDYKELIKPHVETLKEIVRGAKKNVMKSEEHIQSKKAFMKYAIGLGKLRREWGISVWELKNGLNKIPGAKTYLLDQIYRYRYRGSLYKFNVRIK